MEWLQIPIEHILYIINESTISVLITSAGFEFTVLSILVVLLPEKSKILIEDKVIYRIIAISVICFLISTILMIISLNIFTLNLEIIRYVQVEKAIMWISVYLLANGFVSLFVAIRFISWIV